MRRTKQSKLLLSAAALSLLMAACGSDGDDGSNGSGETEKPSGGEASSSAAIDPSKDFELDRPVKIVALISDPTNSDDPNTNPDYNNGAKLAIDDINAAGGIGGHDVEFKAFDTPPTGDEVINAWNLAVAEEPDIIIGPVSSTAALAISNRAEEEKIPLLHLSTDPNLQVSGEGGNEWLFGFKPSNTVMAESAANYLKDDLGAEKIAVLSINAAFGQQGVVVANDILGDLVSTERTFAYNETNLTEPIQAAADADAIFDWGTPNTVAAAAVTRAQQGLDIPHMSPSSGDRSFRDALGDDSILENVYATVDCNPLDDARDYVGAWADRYEEIYGEATSHYAASVYDTILVTRKAIEESESLDPAAISDAL